MAERWTWALVTPYGTWFLGASEEDAQEIALLREVVARLVRREEEQEDEHRRQAEKAGTDEQGR